jgi:Domain of unknown function (DUF222)
MLERSAPPNSDGPDGGAGDDDGFRDRRVWLDLHFRGAGKLNGDLTPECAAALTAMLDALGKKAGPEDTRTTSQHHHDALEEACRPGRPGPPCRAAPPAPPPRCPSAGSFSMIATVLLAKTGEERS